MKSWVQKVYVETLLSDGAAKERDEVVEGLHYLCLLHNGRRYLFVRKAPIASKS